MSKGYVFQMEMIIRRVLIFNLTSIYYAEKNNDNNRCLKHLDVRFHFILKKEYNGLVKLGPYLIIIRTICARDCVHMELNLFF